MGFLGGLIGSGFGHIAGSALGGSKGADLGSRLGQMAGSELIPFAKGGMVKKTGPAKLHAGEMVVPKHLVKKVSKSLKKEIKKGGGRNM